MDGYGLLKAAYYSVYGWLASALLYFFPLEGLVISISIAFVVNFATGILTGILIQNEGVNFKKALLAFCEVAVYLVILTCLFTIGEKMKSQQTVFNAGSILTWAWIAFYVANWSKNLKRLFPESKGISFFFFVLNLEFVKRIPYLKKFEENEKTEHPCGENTSQNT